MNFLASFNMLTRLVILWSFTVLAFFGGMHPPAIGLFLLFFALGVYCRSRNIRLHPNIWLATSLLVIVGALVGWFYIAERFLSVVYVFLYLILNKLFTGSRNRDYLQIYGLSFFMMLAAAVSTSSVLFGFALLVYLFLVLTALITITIKDDAERALIGSPRKQRAFSFTRRKEPAARTHRLQSPGRGALERLFSQEYLTYRYMRWLTGAMLFILVVAGGIFTIIPRVQGRNYFANWGLSSPGQARSGFTDTVEFTAMGEIQTNPAIVMRAIPGRGWEMHGGAPGMDILRLRGTSLDYFDGRRWSKGTTVNRMMSLEERSRMVAFRRREGYQNAPVKTTTIQTQPTHRGYLFGPDRTHQFALDFETVAQVDRESESLQVPPWGEVMTYRVESSGPTRDWYERSLAEKKRLELIESGIEIIRSLASDLVNDESFSRRVAYIREYEEFVNNVYLQLPELPDMEVVEELAEAWTAGEEDRLMIVRKIENRLRFDFGYSLDVTFSSRADHLAYFLTEAREAHCEYFATAMALMLRVKGIPARIVNGYATDEWVASGGGYYLVRQEHAHSWVEAWFPNAGWITFDPTPSSGLGANRVPSNLYRRVTRWMDSLRLAWYRSVIDFSAQDQTVIYSSIARFLHSLPSASSITGGGGNTFSGRRGALLLVIGFAIVILLGFLAREIHRLSKQRKPGRETAFAIRPPDPRTLVYLDLLTAMQERVKRRLSQTPLEYARTVTEIDTDLREFVPLTTAYYAARFNDDVWTEEDTVAARRLLRKLRGEQSGG